MIDTMDDYWKIFQDVTDDIDEFEKRFLPTIYLKPTVHKDVLDSFDVIRDLLHFSYCRHKFYDVAFVQSLLVLEMALKTRYKEVTGEDWGNKKLVSLINWFVSGNYFEVYNPHFMQSIREIRNQLAHPISHAVRGAATRPIIENVVDLINELYEDPVLRKQRMDLSVSIRDRLNQFSNGIKITGTENSQLCYKAWVAFINNKAMLNKIYFYFKPLFQTKDYLLENRMMLPTPLHYVIAEEVSLSDDCIVLTLPEKQMITVTGNLSDAEIDAFCKWKLDYESFCKLTGDEHTTASQMSDSFLYLMREFHRE